MWAHPEAKSVLRHGQIVFCQGCNAVMTQLRRNLDENLLQGFSDESMVSFYATCAAQRKGHGGRLSWSSVKASLTNLLTETEMSSYTQRVLGRSLPKSVWLAQGYLEEVIDKQPSYFDTQLGTTVYTVAVKEQEWAEVFTRITQKIMESEARATQRKASGKRKQQDSSLPDLDLPAEFQEGEEGQEGRKGPSAPGQEAESREHKARQPSGEGFAPPEQAAAERGRSLASCPEGRAGGAGHRGPARVRPQAEGRLKRAITAPSILTDALYACINIYNYIYIHRAQNLQTCTHACVPGVHNSGSRAGREARSHEGPRAAGSPRPAVPGA